MFKKKVIIFMNFLIFLVIAFFAYIRFHRVSISFDCEHGKHPVELIKVSKDNFPGIGTKELKAIFIFNGLPETGVLENVDKIYNLYKDRMSFGVIFAERFKSEYDFYFPYKRLFRYKFSCNKTEWGTESSYFLLLQGEEIIYVSSRIDFFGLNFAVQKRLNPSLTIASAQLPARKLKSAVIKRINEEELKLLDINTDTLTRIDNFSGFSKIYFFHADCSGCQLKRIFQDLKLIRILNQEKVIIIFSIFANPSELKLLLKENAVNLPLYVDVSDEFLLAAKITDDRENPLIITAEELKGGS